VSDTLICNKHALKQNMEENTYLETRKKWYGKLGSMQINPSRCAGKECGI